MHSFQDFDKRWAESEKKGRRAIAFVIALKILSIGFVLYGVISLTEKFNNANTETKALIGKKIVLGKDTLQILDYSTLQRTYTLSNGTEVSIELVSKLPMP